MEDDYKLIVQKLSSVEKLRKNLMWKYILKGEKMPPSKELDTFDNIEQLVKKNRTTRFKNIMGILASKRAALEKA